MQLLFPVLLLLGACSIIEVPATTKELKDKIEAQLPVIEKGKGQVCFLRLKQFTGSAVSPDIYVDENKIKDLSNNSYFCVNLTPNDYFITAKMIFIKDMNIFISIYERLIIDIYLQKENF